LCLTAVELQADAESPTVTVGQEEEPIPAMRRPNVGRGEHTPFDIRPHFGKVDKDSGEPKRNVSEHVLAEQVAGSALAVDAEHFGPEVAGVGGAASHPCGAERLAWVSANDEIHAATPRSSVEGS
jgi:hypothetical protein